MTFFAASSLVSVPEKLLSACGAWLATGMAMRSSTARAAPRVSKVFITNLHLFTVELCSFGTNPICIGIGVKNNGLARKNRTPFQYYVPTYEANPVQRDRRSQ